MVCCVFDTTPEDGTITIKYLNPSRRIRDSNEVARDFNVGFGVGSLENPRVTTKPMLINAKLEARKGAPT